MLTTSEYDQLFRFFRQVEERFYFVDKIAEKLGFEGAASLDAIENTLIERLNELDEFKNSNKFQWNGEIKELNNFLDSLADAASTLELNLTDIETAKNEAESACSDVEYALSDITSIVKGIENAMNKTQDH